MHHLPRYSTSFMQRVALGEGGGVFYLCIVAILYLMGNYNRDQSCFPTFNKLIILFSYILNRFPATTGQLFFYLCLVVIDLILFPTGIIESGNNFDITLLFFSSFYRLFQWPLDVRAIVFLLTVFLTSVGTNKFILKLFPNNQNSKAKLLFTSFIVGVLSFLPTNILGLYIINLFI
jgi:hypothetical protein